MDKTNLQLILIGAGAVIIALIYFWGKYSERKERTRDSRQRVAERSPEQEPIVSFDASAAEIDTAEHQLPNLENTPSEEAEALPPPEDVKIMPIPPANHNPSYKEQEKTPLDWQQSHHPELSQQLDSASEGDESASPQAPKMTVILMILAAPGNLFQGSSILLAFQEQKLKLQEGIFECFAEGQTQGKSVFGVGHLLEPGTFDLENINNLQTPGLIMFMHLPGPLEPIQATHHMIKVAKTLADNLGGKVCDERRNKITAQGFSKMESDAGEFQRQLRLRPN